MGHDDPSFLLSQALAALGGVPAEVTAGSRLGSYALVITGAADGRLTARCLGAPVPAVSAELAIRVVSRKRLSHTIDCVVRDRMGEEVELEVRSIHRLRGRRSVDRAPIKELFLIHAETEVDVVVEDVSQDGMRFTSPVRMEIGSEVRGMLNVAGQVIPIAAEVRHSTKHPSGFTVGIRFRLLRVDEVAVLSTIGRETSLGRRGEDGPSSSPADDVRERLRRWAA